MNSYDYFYKFYIKNYFGIITIDLEYEILTHVYLF